MYQHINIFIKTNKCLCVCTSKSCIKLIDTILLFNLFAHATSSITCVVFSVYTNTYTFSFPFHYFFRLILASLLYNRISIECVRICVMRIQYYDDTPSRMPQLIDSLCYCMNVRVFSHEKYIRVKLYVNFSEN